VKVITLFGARPLRRLVTKYIEDLILKTKNPIAKQARTIKIILNEDDQVVVKKELEIVYM
jgi:ATP-dependent Clp protease ATP-binding subunit ClpA